ncbi:MAG: DUF1385 domain-containing protein [Ruminococcaceae bacterium]|nr:DUF1385 domain-containing protein [Oscillospiraceae bacterium]
MSKKKPNACPMRKTSIGGQALMEGIMMRGPKTTAMAVRNPQGEIVLEKFPTVGKKRHPICRWPIVRGVIGFVDSMTLGYKCLMRSAEISGLEEIEAEMEREKAEKKAAKKAAKASKKGHADAVEADASAVETAAPAVADAANADAEADGAPEISETVEPAPAKKKEKKDSSLLTGIVMAVSMIFAIAIMIGLFFLLPSFLYKDVMEAHIPGFPRNNRFLQSLCTTAIRLLLLIGYMSCMLLMKDIRRTFQFHGAEHKTIFCYEHGLELTVENVRKERRFHPRCGTSFLVLMLLVSILIGFFIPATLNKWLLTGIKLLIMPLVMGIGYELIKLCGRYDNFMTRIIAAPGLWFQRITVLEPDDDMIECAIVAMKEAIPDDQSDML